MKKFFPLVFVIAALVGCSRSTPLHDSMEGMGGSFKAMRKSDDIEVLKAQWAVFKTELNVAATQQVLPMYQTSFNEGMDKLKGLVVSVDAALAAGNLGEVKNLLQQLDETRKEFHKKLEVK